MPDVSPPEAGPQPPAPEPGRSVARHTLLWTIIGVVATVIGASVAAFVALDGSTSASPVTGTQSGSIDGNGNTINNYQQFKQDMGSDDSDDAARAAARRYTDVPPQGNGPWPFLVTDVGSLGLIVRTSGLAAGQQIGSAGVGATIWADCIADTGFDPSGNVTAGSRWLKIRWPHRTPTRAFANSAPSDPAQGWVYSGYLVPAGHNGQIPRCTTHTTQPSP